MNSVCPRTSPPARALVSARKRYRVLGAVVLVAVVIPFGGYAQEPAGGSSGDTDLGENDPHVLYESGAYARAAELFAERAERRPRDSGLQLNLGSALHELGDFEAARSAFGRAAESTESKVRAKALYDLGNTAYRQGRLDDAIARYQEALALAPEDEDAKFNLEFVQREKERRQQQAQQRQQNQDQQNQDQDQQSQDQSQENQEQQGQNQQNQSGQEESQPQQNGDNSAGEPQDTDGDGLSDELENSAENRTDPNRADSDGDGRSDGEEDRNGNGRVDPGESDPNRRDEAPGAEQGQGEQPQDAQDDAPGPGETQPQSAGQLSPEEAARLLAALEDKRPPSGKRKPAQTTKKAKDW